MTQGDPSHHQQAGSPAGHLDQCPVGSSMLGALEVLAGRIQTDINQILLAPCKYYRNSLSMQRDHRAKLTGFITQNNLTATMRKFSLVPKYPPQPDMDIEDKKKS